MLASGRNAPSQVPAREGANGQANDQSANGQSANGASNGSGRSGAARYEVLERRGEGTLWIVYRVRERASKNGGARGDGARNGARDGARNGARNGDGGNDGNANPMLALKALKSVANRHPRLAMALAHNARQWASLSHSNLATPRDVGIEDKTLFHTTRWLPAPSLEARLERGPLEALEALRITGQIAGALRFLAEQNLPHGDVRPRQIGFDSQGAPVLTDGGFAQAFADSGLALADVQPEVAHYLAPERSQGAGLSAPADVYALGVCFYQMLCGRVPFDGASPLAIAARHRNEAPAPPSQFNPRLSRDLDELALRLLDKDPANRPSAAELETMLGNSAPALSSGVVLAPAAPQSDDDLAPNIAVGAPVITTGAVAAGGPKRRPLDEVVAETMAADADRAREITIRRARRKHRWREFGGAIGALLWLAIMIGGAAGGVYGAYLYWENQAPKEVVVPNYVGQSSDGARQLLARKGLTMKVTREAYDPKVAAGTVLAGDPAPERKVRSQREVIVTVSAGTAPIKMVDFSKLSLDQARQIITQHGLRLGQTISQFHPSVPRGYVCGQYPESGEALRRSEPITLIVSRGPQPTEIDAQRGIGMDGANAVIDPSQGATNSAGLGDASNGNTTFAPLEPASQAAIEKAKTDAAKNAGRPAPVAPPAPVSNELKTKRATIRVNVPSGGGRQEVKITVRDANGQRTVYARSRSAGSSVSRTVSATRPDSDPATVRVYVGGELVREDSL